MRGGGWATRCKLTLYLAWSGLSHLGRARLRPSLLRSPPARTEARPPFPERRISPRAGYSDKGPTELRLEPTATLSGRLLDVTGQPRAGVEVRSLPAHQRTSPWGPERVRPALAGNDRSGGPFPNRGHRCGNVAKAPGHRVPGRGFGLHPGGLDTETRRGEGPWRTAAPGRELRAGAEFATGLLRSTRRTAQ